jgi:hypothetical protein
MSSDGGKGSVPRPIAVDRVTYDSNWDIIFNRKKKKEDQKFDEDILKTKYYEDVDPDWPDGNPIA